MKYFVNSLDSGHVEIADSQNAVEVLEILEEATNKLLNKL